MYEGCYIAKHLSLGGGGGGGSTAMSVKHTLCVYTQNSLPVVSQTATFTHTHSLTHTYLHII